jgi:hypothetical protein
MLCLSLSTSLSLGLAQETSFSHFKAAPRLL